MKKTLHFRYESIENFCRLLLNITFEKSNFRSKYSGVWYKIYDNTDGEQLIKNFLEKLYPDGATIGEQEITALFNMCIDYIENTKDEKVRNLINADIKRKNPYWVYSKYENRVYPCEFAEHTQTVSKIVANFFKKTLREATTEEIKKFILSNCVVHSENLTVEQIANDSRSVGIQAFAFIREEA